MRWEGHRAAAEVKSEVVLGYVPGVVEILSGWLGTWVWSLEEAWTGERDLRAHCITLVLNSQVADTATALKLKCDEVSRDPRNVNKK